MILLAYGNIPERQGYELFANVPDLMIVKEQVVPGDIGEKPLHITYVWAAYEGKDVLIVSYTNHELRPIDREMIAEGALEFLSNAH